MPRHRKVGADILSFCKRFPNEVACLEQIFKTKYGDHTPCPKCGKIGRWGLVRDTKKYFHTCRKQVSLLAGTPFYRSNFSLTACFYAILLFSSCSSGVRSSFLRRQIGTPPKSTHRLCNLVRLQMANYDRPTKLGGPGKRVEVDEVLIRHVRIPGSDRYYAAQIMGIACEGKLITGIIPDRTRSTLHANIKRWVVPGSIIITDDWAAYRSLDHSKYKHITVNHSKGYFNEQGYSTCEIDSFWATLRRCMRGYHQVAADNLWLFLAEIECRYNWRRDRSGLFEHLISNWSIITAASPETLRQRFDWRITEVADSASLHIDVLP